MPARAETTPKPIVLPPGNAVQLTVGGTRRFSVTVTDEDVEIRWTLDGTRVGSGRTFEFAPAGADIGAHEIAVTVLRGSAATRHVWRVTVAPPPVPKIVDVTPSTAVVRTQPGTKVAFRYVVRSNVPTDDVSVVWTVDGVRVATGTTFTLEVEAAGRKRVRAVASSDLGVVQAREWSVLSAGEAVATARAPDAIEPDPELEALLKTMEPEQRTPTTAAPRRTTTTARVAPATTTSSTAKVALTTSTVVVARPAPTTSSSVPPATTSSTARPTTTSSAPAPRATTSTGATRRTTTSTVARPRTTSSTVARAVVTTTTRPPAPPPTVAVARAVVTTTTRPPAPTGIRRAEVVAFLERYARAYEARSVAELRRIGQVTSAAQAEALARYFEQVRDLEVRVRLLEVETRGDVARVRYRRRDRFRDPTGHQVEKETPPIEKEIRRTPSGLVFMPSS